MHTHALKKDISQERMRDRGGGRGGGAEEQMKWTDVKEKKMGSRARQ